MAVRYAMGCNLFHQTSQYMYEDMKNVSKVISKTKET